MRIPPSVTGPVSAARWAVGGLRRRLAYREVPGDDRDWSNTEKVVALTFDDGPEAVHQAALLVALTARKARATFFVLGEQVIKNPVALRDIVAAGHEVAAHGYTHADVGRHTVPAADREMAACLAAIDAEAPGTPVRWYRPPFGHMGYAAKLAANSLGMGAIRWTVDPQDWRAAATEEGVAEHVLRRLHPGAVILLHSGMPHTPEAVCGILDGLEERGYRTVTVSELSDLQAATHLRPPGAEKSRTVTRTPHSGCCGW